MRNLMTKGRARRSAAKETAVAAVPCETPEAMPAQPCGLQECGVKVCGLCVFSLVDNWTDSTPKPLHINGRQPLSFAYWTPIAWKAWVELQPEFAYQDFANALAERLEEYDFDDGETEEDYQRLLRAAFDEVTAERAAAAAAAAGAAAVAAFYGPTDANGTPVAEPDQFGELASWTADEVLDWVSAHSTHSDSLQALDEACQALPEPQRSEVNQRITEAYTWLACHTLANIQESRERLSQSQCARSAEEPATVGAKPEATASEAQTAEVEAELEAVASEAQAEPETLDQWRGRLNRMGLDLKNFHKWTSVKILNWIQKHPTAEALQAIDELADTLPQKAVTMEKIADAYHMAAFDGTAGITAEVAAARVAAAAESLAKVKNTFGEAATQAMLADEEPDDDLAMERSAILHALGRWQSASPTADELMDLVQPRSRGSMAMEKLAAAFVELQQQDIIECDADGVVRMVASGAEPAEVNAQPEASDANNIEVLPSKTGTVIAHVTANGQDSYLLIAGPYRLSIPHHHTDKERLVLARGLLLAVEDRLDDFQQGPFSCPHNVMALRYVRAALEVNKVCLSYETINEDAHLDAYAEPQDGVGPGGACHHYEVNDLQIQFQRGPRAEVGSVPGVLDADLLKVALMLVNACAWESSNAAFGQLIELAESELIARQADRMVRGVLGLNQR